MTREIPIACYLTDKELQQRRRDHLNKIAASLVDFKELENVSVIVFRSKNRL